MYPCKIIPHSYSFYILLLVDIWCSSISRTFETDRIFVARFALKATDDTLYHEEKPEYMETDKSSYKGKKHIQHREVHVSAGWLVCVTFPIEMIDDMDGEEPESEKDPRGQHRYVCRTLHSDRRIINSQLENRH